MPLFDRRGGAAVSRLFFATDLHGSTHTFRKFAGLHGHIHEAHGLARIGRTLCFNPGSEYGEGVLNGVILALRNGRLSGYQFTSG